MALFRCGGGSAEGAASYYIGMGVAGTATAFFISQHNDETILEGPASAVPADLGYATFSSSGSTITFTIVDPGKYKVIKSTNTGGPTTAVVNDYAVGDTITIDYAIYQSGASYIIAVIKVD